MPFDSSGTFNRVTPGGWKADAAAGIKIRADRHDSEDDGFATGLSTCITKDGRTQPTANLPMNGKKLTGVGDPTGPQDVATKNYVDTFKSFTTGAIITGADANGQIVFSSPSGANGLAWTGADLSWIARLAGAPAAGWPARLVLNNKVDGTGTDVVSISETGMVNLDRIMGNTFYDTVTPAWKAIVAGWSNQMDFDAASGNTLWYASSASVAAGATVSLNLNMNLTSAGNLSVRGSTTTTAVASSGRVSGSDIMSAGVVYANNGNTFLNTDGNVVGSIWSNWGSSDAYNAINARIEARATAWANDRVSNLQYRKVSLGYNATSGGFSNLGSGTVVCGYSREGGSTGQVAGLYYVTLQAYDPVRGWVSFQG